MHFGENQLSPGSIGISPLPTGHPPVLQHWWVRASTRCYARFTLPMGSSPGFGSYPRQHYDCALLQTRFRSGSGCFTALNLAARRARLTRRIILQKARRHRLAGPKPDNASPPTACERRVSGSLSPPSRGAFHLSLTVLVHYRSARVFSLGGWSPQLPTGFLVSRGTQDTVVQHAHASRRRLRDSHPLRWRLPSAFA